MTPKPRRRKDSAISAIKGEKSGLTPLARTILARTAAGRAAINRAISGKAKP